jgi:hypothetical protein
MASKSSLESGFKRIGQLSYGARFYRVDLHFHTPASSDARGSNRYSINPCKGTCSLAITKVEPGDADIAKDSAAKQKQAVALAAKMVERFRAEKISVVAVTDHNSIGTIWPDYKAKSKCMNMAAPTWYELLDDEARKLNAKEGKDVLTILPGAEIGTADIHILAVFPPQEPRRNVHFMICDLLSEIGFAINDFGKVSVVGNLSVESSIDLIARKGGIPILAHIDGSDKAWLRKMKLHKLGSASMTSVLRCKDLRAAEIVEPASLKKEPKNEKKAIKTLIDEVRKDVGLEPVAYFRGSDAHDLKTIGKRYSFAKMTKPSFSGLKSAIQAPSSRLRISGEVEEQLAASFVYGMEIDGPPLGKHTLRFNRQINCVIGKKDADKSAIFRLMQAACDPGRPQTDASINLFVEKTLIEKGKPPECRYFVFSRAAKTDSCAIHPISAAGKAGKEIDPAEADKLEVRPRFYTASDLEELVSSKAGFGEFLVTLFGKPTATNVAKFNERMDIPEFCTGKTDRLLIAKKGRSGYLLYGNTNWREGKEKHVPFHNLNKSMQKTLAVCMFLVSGSGNPLILDSPEMCLDNEDIVKYLVPILKTYTDRRQVVMFTSSALLAINTDPDNYILLDPEAKIADRVKSGFSIDDIEEKDLIINLMEGSMRSFKRRVDRYKS